MKNIISLALAAGLLVGAAAPKAEAAEISAFGLFRVTGEVTGSANTLPATGADVDPTFKVNERIEVGMKVKVSDAVSGEFRIRAPHNQEWNGSAVDVDTTLRTAYMQFPIANLTARVGYQLPALPTIASGANPVARGWVSLPGVAIFGNFGMITPSLSWYTTNADKKAGTDPVTPAIEGTNTDSYSLVIPVALADGMTLTPWVNAAVNTEPVGDLGKFTRTTLGASFDAKVSNINAGVGVIYAMTSIEDSATNLVVAGNFAMDLGALTPGLAVWYGMQGEVADGGGILTDTYGHWGSFNGANDAAYGNTSGLNSGVSGLGLTHFNSLGLQVNVADIALGDTTSLGAHVLYLMSTVDKVEKSGLEVGVLFNTQVAQGLGLVVDAYYVMPMGDLADDAKAGAKDGGFAVAGTLNMPF